MAIDQDRDPGQQLLLEAARSEVHSAGGARAGEPTYAPSIMAEEPAGLLAPPVDEPTRAPSKPDAKPVEQAVGGDAATRGRFRKRPIFWAMGLIALASSTSAAALYWDNGAHFESTDDAFIAARQFSVAPKVSDYIIAVPVTDNQHAAAGDVIARIDPHIYRAALDQAKAQLAHDQAVLQQAEMDLKRYQILLKQDSIASQTAQDQVFTVEQDKATVAVDQANVETAQLNLSNTTVAAAQPGRVANLSAAVGQYVTAGTALATFVPDEIWVTANFKETKLDRMRPGQSATIEIDAYPERVLHGRVESVQPGSGTAFSLPPAENATGNYVKIVQRVPVKIVPDDPPADVALGPGMSVVPTVRVDPTPSLYERLNERLSELTGGRL
jgi:membrane fusion protein (multidrug efflux system)